MKILSIQNCSVQYGNFKAIENISLEMEQGCVACLLGPSGSGKTTLLRGIAGLISISQGKIEIAEQLVSSKNNHVETCDRRIGFVFQDFALFPHLNVQQNISFGLKNRGSTLSPELEELSNRFKINGLMKRFPHQISGGQQQRVAIARALAQNPSLLLMDEPFSQLDLNLRSELATELKDYLKSTQTSALIVTHSRDESFLLADEMGIILDGRLEAWGEPHRLYRKPNNKEVALFLGPSNMLEVQSKSDTSAIFKFGEYPVPRSSVSRDGLHSVRPEDIEIIQSKDAQFKVVSKSRAGALVKYILQSQKTGCRLVCHELSDKQISTGEVVDLSFKRIFYLPEA